MAHDKGQLVHILRGGDQREVEGDNRTALFIQRLERVGRLVGAIINNDLIITAPPLPARALFAFGLDLRLHPLRDVMKLRAAICGVSSCGMSLV